MNFNNLKSVDEVVIVKSKRVVSVNNSFAILPSIKEARKTREVLFEERKDREKQGIVLKKVFQTCMTCDCSTLFNCKGTKMECTQCGYLYNGSFTDDELKQIKLQNYDLSSDVVINPTYQADRLKKKPDYDIFFL